MGLLIMCPIIVQPNANVYSYTPRKHLWCSSPCGLSHDSRQDDCCKCFPNCKHDTHSCMHHSTINFDPLHAERHALKVCKKFPATVATVKCPSDRNNCGHSYNCLILTDESHFIPLHSTLKLKKFLSVWKPIFRNPFLLCCVSFCLLGKIILVSRIQTAFARRKQSGYAKLGKMDFQHPVHAVKKSFRLVSCLENIIHGEVAFDATRFHISTVLSK